MWNEKGIRFEKQMQLTLLGPVRGQSLSIGGSCGDNGVNDDEDEVDYKIRLAHIKPIGYLLCARQRASAYCEWNRIH